MQLVAAERRSACGLAPAPLAAESDAEEAALDVLGEYAPLLPPPTPASLTSSRPFLRAAGVAALTLAAGVAITAALARLSPPVASDQVALARADLASSVRAAEGRGGDGCDTQCSYDGWTGTCKSFVQWAANHEFAESGAQACVEGYGLMISQCPMCWVCQLAESECVVGQQLDETVQPAGAPNRGCDTMCKWRGFSASCQTRVKYWANHDFLFREAYQCVEAFGETVVRCPDCHNCDFAEVGCIAKDPDDSLEKAQEVVGEQHELVEQVGACDQTCSYKGQEVSCKELVQYAANHRFSYEQDACEKGHAEVLQWCSQCKACTFPQSACEEGQNLVGYVSPHSCEAYGCAPFAPLDNCQCNPGCEHFGNCCADFRARCGPHASTSAQAHSPVPWTDEAWPAQEADMPNDGYRNHYDPFNPLRVHVDRVRSKNYFLILGDWGKADGAGPCQLAVARKMRAYVEAQRQLGRNLMFIGTVGDNFYWTGVHTDMWESSWANVYGVWDPSSPMYHVPWLAVLGNHDYGNTDAFSLCPERQPRHTINGQHYASNQFNADRNPSRPDHGCIDPAVASREPSRCAKNTSMYWMPDYSWHYELPQASVEVIALDTNYHTIDTLGGDVTGHTDAFHRCGGREVVQAHLSRVGDAAKALLRARARANTASTVVILQHYPGHCMKEIFMEALPEHRRGQVHVLCAYGHVHDQKCDGNDPVTGVCTSVLTGGGGGCCAPNVNLGGFTAVRLEDDGSFVTDVDSEEVRLPFGTCSWAGAIQPPRGAAASPGEIR